MMKPAIAVAGVCSVLICTQTIAAPAASKDAKKPQTPLSETVSSHRAEMETRYAEQDKELLRADQLAKGGRDEDYEAALKIYQDVHLGLELEVGSLESWIARRRFNEVGTRLDALRMEYGNKKLQEANTAFNEGRYGDAADLAAKVSAVCPALNEKAAQMRIIARSRQKGEERLLEVSADTLLPNLKKNELSIEKELAEARVLMKNRKFEEARRRVENVYKINPFNQEAAYLASQIYAQYYTAGYHRSQADARSMMASEAWQWVEPAFYRGTPLPSDDSQVKSSGDQKIQAQLDAIVIPSVKYDATNISSVVTHLMNASKRFDDNGKGSGVIIDYIAPVRAETAAETPAANANAANNADGENLDDGEGNKPAPAAAAAAPAAPTDKEIFVTLNVNNASLREILDYISFLTDLPYRVYPERVVIGALSDDVRREIFQLTPEALKIITGDNNAPGAEAGADTAAAGDTAAAEGEVVKGDVMTVDISAEDLKRFFSDFGIDFKNPRSNISYGNGKITVTNTQENLNQMDRFIRKLNTDSEMVQIELKTIEISESDMEELGFNWSLGFDNVTDGKTILKDGDKWSLAQGANAVLGGALNQLSSSLVDNSASLVNGLNLFPNIFGSSTPFGSDIRLNLSLTINAIDRNDRSETISAPSVTVANKMTAVVKLTTNYYFPDDWEEPEMEIESGDESGEGVRWTAPMPEFDEETEIGTIFTVTPTIKKNGIIGLSINPKVNSYIGKDSHIVDGTIYVREGNNWVADPDQSKSFEVWKPVISNRELKLEVNVKDGETLVLGGVSDSQMQTRVDKIPILGDIPLIGRLFQSHSEISTRKNSLIFVTARLVNDQGMAKEVIYNGGIPDVNR